MVRVHVEARFEDEIEASLLASGWLRGQSSNYRPDLGLDTAELYAFIGATQQDQWDRLITAYGGTDAAQREFAKLLAKEIDERGALDVLRHGVKDRSVPIRLAYFRPGHTLALGALDDYRANRLTVVRQLHYSTQDPGRSLDLTLFLNGIPLATAELKNPATGQHVEHAKHQYRADRDPKELVFARRTLAHFAVDPGLVFVTTRLAGQRTRFLPFNTGSAGPGRAGGAGNPPAKAGGYRTSYLWERVWQRDAWLDIVHRFLHVEHDATRKGRAPAMRRGDAHLKPLIFPRFHQWHAARELARHAERHGAGTNYLVQHSAGSGKSNTIAWLAHRLSSLHTPETAAALAPEAAVAGLQPNEPVFHKVVVITDRRVLDQQLQDTIFQFEHVAGVVQRIDEDSAQLAEALAGQTARIVITTLQKFPFVLDRVSDLGDRRYAILIDEAHSSQSGESAAALKRVLGRLGSDDIDADGDPLTAAALARGRHPNLSYFAFTATPKARTLELFGTRNPATGVMEPFHVYSMRQAIDEGFILDVLRNYLTYKTYWRLRNAAADQAADPQVDERKAKAKLVRAAELHPSSQQQRAQIIVDHFREHTMSRLGGRARAMVVTRSREHAVTLYQAIRSYVAKRELTGCGTLVAFSGTLNLGGIDYTEPKLNGFPEGELRARFEYVKADDPHAATRNQPEYRILVVAEKYQTGYDQPLLTTMYVDKPLVGVAAVQTLSRLNRIHPRKSQEDICVLDLANEADDIQAAFKPFFEATLTEPTDPNLLYLKERDLKGYQLLVDSEIDAFARAYQDADRAAAAVAQKERAHAQLYRFTDPARDRYVALLGTDPEAAEEFRGALNDYIRAYGFLSQVVGYGDRDLEALYLYGKFLWNRLPRRHEAGVDIGQVDLTHLRIARTGERDVRLVAEGVQVLPGFAPDGGSVRETNEVPLSQVIAELNDLYGLGLGTGDQVWVGQQIVALAEDPAVAQAGLVNNLNEFGQVFDRRLEGVVIERAEANDTLVKRFFDDAAFHEAFTQVARRQAYDLIRRPARRETERRLLATGGETPGADRPL
ncbi:MAG TPA: type I restriction endonuclease [Micromonosporaceae bacterium]|nr:type I restriction endonuclease [Micromonosporaceae bacterium]